MKKKITLILLIIIVLILSFFVCDKLISKDKTKIDTIQPISQAEGLILPDSFETKTLNPDDPYVKFELKYPYFKNADNDFNSKIETFVKSQIPDFIKLSEENWMARYDTQSEGENFPKVPQKDEDKFYLFSDFTVIQSNSTYISFVMKYGGFSGGAHGYENNVSFNYDVKNKKDILLKDLFPNDPKYLENLSVLSRDILKKKDFAKVSDEDRKNSSEEGIRQYLDSILSSIDTGTEPNIENFSVFTFTEDKIKIYFGQYQVGPYAIGMPEIEIDRK